MIRSAATREKPCKVCGAIIRRQYPGQLRRVSHCSKRCEGQSHTLRIAFSRLEALTAKGLLAMSPVEAFRWGYKLGYARRANRETRQRARSQRTKAA